MRRSDKLKAGKFDVDVPLVQRLIATQFPQWADLAIRPVVDDGWDNWTFRLGDRLKVRLPSAEGYAEQAEKEARWLPRLAPHLPAEVPVPAGLGEPGQGYPWRWSVYDWIEGDPVRRANIADLPAFAGEVARFLTALQEVDATGAPRPGQHNYYRGAAPMSIYGEEARRSVIALDGMIDTHAANEVLSAAAAAASTRSPVWVHGDVAIGNLLIRDGRLNAVIDFGCLAAGDPACDLAIAWVFFDGESREAFRAGVVADSGTWARARGWALWKAALVLASNSPINPYENRPIDVIAAVVEEHRRQG